MRLVNEKLAADLPKMGKREFLFYGFQGANLRSIAALVGVTTGAIYRYYTDKAELLGALVERPAVELLERYREIQKPFFQPPLEQQLSGLPEVSGNGQIWMMRHVYDNFDVLKFIIYCPSGIRYEHYIGELVEIKANASYTLIDRMNESRYKLQLIDDELTHIVSNVLFNGMLEAVRHDMPRDKAFVHMDGLREFHSAGWFKVLGTSQLWFSIYS